LSLPPAPLLSWLFGHGEAGVWMGYATKLYAIDLDALMSAVGSRNARLLKRLRPAQKSLKGGQKDPMQGPRIKLTSKSEIILNGQPVSFDELRTELNRRKWKGTYLFTYLENGRRTGRWSKPGSFARALSKVYPWTQFLGEMTCDSDEDLAHGWQDEEISEEQAAAELIEGWVSKPQQAHQYGYGLERLCQLLGSRLATIEGKRGMLQALKLNTPLSKERSPVSLPQRDDFPVIGYLTADEVECEVERLRKLDLSSPKRAAIEEGRKTFFRCLKEAAKRRTSLVAFYY
jgi:hypothetical protein